MARAAELVGLSAAFVLLSACCALPMPSSETSPVVLLSAAPDDELWFHAMEDRPAQESVIPRSTGGARLGESYPSADEENSNLPGERGTVKNTQEDPKEPQPSSPRVPMEVRNPYGQMVTDMHDMKTSEKQLSLQHRIYKKLKYHQVSDDEEYAVMQTVAANQLIANSDLPDQPAMQAADQANVQLVQAVTKRRKEEKEGAKHFATKDFRPVPDAANPDASGPFSKLYKLNLQMKRGESAEKKMMDSFNSPPMSKQVARELYPNPKTRIKERSDDDTFFANQVAPYADPKHSKAYYDAHKKAALEDKLMNELHEAATSYKVRKLKEPNLKYADMVKGTSIEGITNFYAMDAKQLEHETEAFALMSKGLHQHEVQLDQAEEKYLQEYDPETPMTPLEQWSKKWNIEREVNKEVKDPDNPVTEKQIDEDAAKLKQEYLHPDLEGAVKTLQDIKKQEEVQRDEQIADIVSQAPMKPELEAMTKEGIIGAKELEADTAAANKKLQDETAHPHHFGPLKKLDPGKDVDYARSDEEQRRRENREDAQRRAQVLLKDAQQLKESGSRAALHIMNSDTTAVHNGEPTNNPQQRASIVEEQKYYNQVRKAHGKDAMEHVQEGVQASFQKEMTAWNKVKDTVLKGGVSPNYGAEALKSLPTRSGGPELEGGGAGFSMSGNSANAAVPMRMDDASDSGSKDMPEGADEAVKVSVQQAGAEKRPRTGYAAEEDDTPMSKEPKTAEQVAAEVAGKENQKADAEATEVEKGLPSTAREAAAGNSKTDKEAEQQMSQAAAAEGAIEDAADSKKAAAEVSADELPKAQTDATDDAEAKHAVQEINNDTPASQAESHENGGTNQKSTDSGVPAE